MCLKKFFKKKTNTNNSLELYEVTEMIPIGNVGFMNWTDHNGIKYTLLRFDKFNLWIPSKDGVLAIDGVHVDIKHHEKILKCMKRLKNS